MTWLLKLYPPQWRRRYGREFEQLIAPQPFAVRTVIDIIGGAIDAWIQPQAHLATRTTSHSEGDTMTLAKWMRLRCAGYGETPTTVDGLKAAAVILGGTLTSVLVAAWMRRQPIDPVYPEALLNHGWLISFVVSMHYTSLKGWPVRTQSVFIGLLLMVIASIAFGAAWIQSA